MPRAVVLDADQDAAGVVAGGERCIGAAARLAGGLTLGRCFHAVVQRVAHQVHERVADVLDH